ncbi:MAG: hypothetical protein FJ194_08530 [Gammaproteobacteria bacterium]|nr:hypothetical protein [Gammaproteobacteria bacterium]
MSMWSAIVLIVLISIAGGVANNFAKARARGERRNESDALIGSELAALRERVEVLEKIVTDPRNELRRELDALERTG